MSCIASSPDIEIIRKYGPVGKCIYCGTSDSPLSSEHIVPFSLGGHLELVESSCNGCAKETSIIEAYMARTLWGNVRMKFGFPSRRRNSRPTTAAVVAPDETSIDIPVSDYPAVAPMLWLNKPTILDGVLATPEYNLRVRTFKSEGADPAGYGVPYFNIPVSLDHAKYMRFLAKIAHGMAVMRLGVDGFEPVLNDMIIKPSLTQMTTVYAFVGGQPEIEAASHSAAGIVHTLIPNQRRDVNGQAWLCEDIRLFANWTQPEGQESSFGAPKYIVVVGRPNQFTAERLQRGIFYPEAN